MVEERRDLGEDLLKRSHTWKDQPEKKNEQDKNTKSGDDEKS
jgi:hypothetical protein